MALLLLMRHGPAQDRAASGRDVDRELTAEGRRVVERAAERLRAALERPLERIISSPLIRARQTAEIVRRIAGTLQLEVEVHDDLSTDAEPAFDLARAVAAGGRDVMLVGHNPNVDALARGLCPAGTRRIPGFRTAMIVSLAPSLSRNVDAPRDDMEFGLVSVVDPHV